MPAKKEVITEESVEQEVKKPVAKTPRKYAPDDLIPCRSVTYGELLLSAPKSKLMYVWANYNDVTEVEFQDLQALKSTRSNYLFRPRIVIEDEELVEQWSKDFKDMYSKITHVDVEEIFDLPLGKFKTALKNAPKGVQQAVKNIAGEKIMNGSLDSLAKIKAIDEILGTDLKLYLS
jgi:hypothetical protein